MRPLLHALAAGALLTPPAAYLAWRWLWRGLGEPEPERPDPEAMTAWMTRHRQEQR